MWFPEHKTPEESQSRSIKNETVISPSCLERMSLLLQPQIPFPSMAAINYHTPDLEVGLHTQNFLEAALCSSEICEVVSESVQDFTFISIKFHLSWWGPASSLSRAFWIPALCRVNCPQGYAGVSSKPIWTVNCSIFSLSIPTSDSIIKHDKSRLRWETIMKTFTNTPWLSLISNSHKHVVYIPLLKSLSKISEYGGTTSRCLRHATGDLHPQW